MNNVYILFKSKKWEEIGISFTPAQILANLNFHRSVRVAYHLLYNNKGDDVLQEFSIKLLNLLKMTYPVEWNQDWRYEGFLGKAYDIMLKYDERFEALKNAYEMSVNPPPELLIEYARCCACPGIPPLSYDEAIDILKISIEKHPYKRAAILLRGIYHSKKDSVNEKYWSEMAEKIKDEDPPQLDPPFIEEYNRDEHNL